MCIRDRDFTDISVSADTIATTDSSLMSSDMVTDLAAASLISLQPVVTSLPTDFATGKSLMAGVCPGTAPKRSISVTAVTAAALPGGKLIYNSRAGTGGALNDPTAIMYFRS